MDILNTVVVPLQFESKPYPFEVVTYQGFTPIKPIITLLGISYVRQTQTQTVTNLCQAVKLPGVKGRFAPLCVKVADAETLLLSLKPRTEQAKAFLNQLIHFFSVLNDGQLVEVEKPQALKTELKHKVLDEKELQQELETNPIFINQPLGKYDHLRRDLVAVGVRDLEEMNYLVDCGAIQLLQARDDDTVATRFVYPHSYEKGDLIKAARAEFYVPPIFYRLYPTRYEHLTSYVLKSVRDADNRVIGLEETYTPKLLAPWYSDEFANKIAALASIYRRVTEEERDRQAALTGTDLSLWNLDMWDIELDGVTNDEQFTDNRHVAA